jgi:hypothetical protein
MAGCNAFSSAGSDELVVVSQESNADKKTITATGMVIPRKQVMMNFKQNAFGVRIQVKPGESVQTGEILVSSDNIQQTSNLEEARAELARSKAKYDSLLREEYREVRQSEKDAALESIEAAQALVDLAEQNLAATSLKAPFDGTVIEIYPHSFENVNVAEPVLLFADLNTLQIETDDLDEKDAGRLLLGDEVEIFFDAIPDVMIKGQIIEISHKVESGSGTDFNVIISLMEKPAGLRWGMSAYVIIEPGSSTGLPSRQDGLIIAEPSGTGQSESNMETKTTRLCDDADLLSETTSDGSEFRAGVVFQKTWTFRNTGTCTWKPDYKLVFIEGDQMNGPDMIVLGKYVAPGNLVTIELNLEAPEKEGSYFGSWQLQNEVNERLYNLWVDISVIS